MDHQASYLSIFPEWIYSWKLIPGKKVCNFPASGQQQQVGGYQNSIGLGIFQPLQSALDLAAAGVEDLKLDMQLVSGGPQYPQQRISHWVGAVHQHPDPGQMWNQLLE